MISDEAVKAATAAFCQNHDMRAALEAALPHLLASQGCGTGHSADAGTLPALAENLRAIYMNEADVLEYVSRDIPVFGRPITPGADVLISIDEREPIGWRIYGWSKVRPIDGGEAVHSPDERESSRDEPKNDLAHPQKGGEG